MSLSIKVQHRPADYATWTASMYLDGVYVSGSASVGHTREDAIERCKINYEARFDIEWIPYEVQGESVTVLHDGDTAA